MAQVRRGFVDVTNGSNIVTGTNTNWTLDVDEGDLFIVDEDTVPYHIASVESNTQILISANYAGTTKSDHEYVIHKSYSPVNKYPFPERADVNTATIVKDALLLIDSDIQAFRWRGEWDSDVEYAARDYVFTVDQSGEVTIWISSTSHTSNASNAPGEDVIWQEIFSRSDLNTLIQIAMSWQGEWQPSTEYMEGSVVRYQETIYVANTTFTSGATFDPNNWSVLIDVAELEQYKLDAQAASNKAQEWASNPEDQEVESGLYSALHYLEKTLAAKTATDGFKQDAETARDSALNHKDDAEFARDHAESAQTGAENAESAAATSETNAADSASAASTSETNAADSASAAAASESNAADSETAAADSANAASISETNAADSAVDSAAWAENPEDVEVEPYSFSSLHWSEKSRGWSNASFGVEIQPGEYSSKHWSTKSKDWANKDRDVEVEAGEFSAKHYSEVSDDWANAPLGQEIEPGKYSARHWSEQLGVVPESAYNWQGGWVAGTYNAGDAVYHEPTGSSYITLVTTTDEPDFTGTDWQLLAKRGDLTQADFLFLGDTPAEYLYEAGNFVAVNSTEDGLEFVPHANVEGGIHGIPEGERAVHTADMSADHATETETHGAPAGERIAHTGDLGSAAAQDDTRYAHRSNNLSDLGSAGTARNNLGGNAAGDRTVSTAEPSGGSDGDIWYEVD